MTISGISSTSSQSHRNFKNQSSDKPADSVGIMVQASIKAIKIRLELNCGGDVSEIFGVGRGGNGATFYSAYQDYATLVGQLDANICLYLKVLFTKLKLRNLLDQ